MARFSNFRSRVSRGFSSARGFASRGRSRARRVYQSKTLGMKTSTLLKLAVVGVVGYMFKDKILPIVQSLTSKK